MKKHTLGSLIWLRMLRFTHQSNLLSNQFLKQFNLTSAQFDVLVQIATYEPITQSELADKATLTAGGVSRMLTRLEKDGWICRARDWKTKNISLTDEGRTRFEQVFPHQLKFQTDLFEAELTEDEQKQLYKLMSKIQKHSENKMKGDL